MPLAESARTPQAWLRPPADGSQTRGDRQRHRVFGQGHRAAPRSMRPACRCFRCILATSTRRAAWAEAERGLSPADLAMHVVLPEVDGRLLGGHGFVQGTGFARPAPEYSRALPMPPNRRIALRFGGACRRLACAARTPASQAAPGADPVDLSRARTGTWAMPWAWMRPPRPRRSSMIWLNAGYDVDAPEDLSHRRCSTRPQRAWPVETYEAALRDAAADTLRDDLRDAWGAPQDDPAVRRRCLPFPRAARGPGACGAAARARPSPPSCATTSTTI